MNAIAGAIRLDGGPQERPLVERMRAALAHRGGCSTLVRAESPCIAFHGRIDNRSDLAAALRICEPRTDPELAMAAYAAWGESCAPRLLGDFAFAVWDPAARSLLCVRDIVGVKPFYYALVDGTFLFASEAHALFQHPGLQRTPNEGMVAELLNDTVTSREETLFRDVRRLPPAHLLRVRDGILTSRKYWAPSISASDGLRGNADYAAELRALLRESVACRVDRPRTAAQLSGGVDSSTVVATAATLPAPPEIDTYSLVFPGRPCDESRYGGEIVRHFRLRNTAVDVPPCDAAWFARETAQYLECPLGPTAGALGAMYRTARADGFTSMLTGEGGDEWFSGSMHNYADLLARGAIGELTSELVHAPNRGTAFRRVVFAGLWPLVPSSLRPPIRSATRAVMRRMRHAEWLEPSFANRSLVVERCRRPEYDRGSGLSRAAWDIAQYLEDGSQALGFEIADRLAAASGVEQRHPFHDRRIIEFALALPESQRAARGVRKRVLRHAMAGLLPEPVRLRADKADFTGLYLDWFGALGGEAAFDRLAIAEAGWVRPEVLKREYRRGVAALGAGADSPVVSAVWTALAIDAWYRAAVARDPLAVRVCAAAP
jgi:asparagine synthase (glutamine-hydrolysing)